MEGNDTVDGICNGKESECVFELVGEPAVVINGVPNLTPGYAAEPICSNTRRDEESTGDLLFGDWMEGRRVRKLFGDQYYSGKVTDCDEEMNWYKVVYEDGDMEDLEWCELEEILVPLDISVPLTTLALRRGKSEVKAGKSKASHLKDTGSAMTSGIIQELQVQSQDMSAYLMQKSESSLSVPQKSSETNNVGALVLYQGMNETALKDGGFLKQDLSSEMNAAEGSKWQKDIKKRHRYTARAEKQKRRDKSGVKDHPADA